MRLTGLTSEPRPPISILVEGRPYRALTELWEPLEHGKGPDFKALQELSCSIQRRLQPQSPVRSGDPRAQSQGLHQTVQTVPLAPVTAAVGSAQARILVAKGLGAHTGVPRLGVFIDCLSPGHPRLSWLGLKGKLKQCKEANSILPAARGNRMIDFFSDFNRISCPSPLRSVSQHQSFS